MAGEPPTDRQDDGARVEELLVQLELLQLKALEAETAALETEESQRQQIEDLRAQLAAVSVPAEELAQLRAQLAEEHEKNDALCEEVCCGGVIRCPPTDSSLPMLVARWRSSPMNS